MADFTGADAARAMEQLSQLSQARESELAPYADATDSSSDEEESDSPLMDRFTATGGSEAILKITNFSLAEFMQLWNVIGPFIMEKWNTGRGKKCKFGGKDMLFMTIVVMKHGGGWNTLSSSFGV